MLRLQAVPAAAREALKSSPPQLSYKHYKDTNGLENLETERGPPGNSKTETRLLDWVETKFGSAFHNEVVTKSRRSKVDDLSDPRMKEGWTADTIEHGVIHTITRSKEGKWIFENVSTGH